MNRFTALASILFLSSAIYLIGSPGFAQELQIENGDFSQWNDETPVGWEVEIGATTGQDNPLSVLKQGDGPSLEMGGTAETLVWQVISQTIDIEANKTYRVRFSARGVDLKREGNQFENCYVGLLQLHHRGQELVRDFHEQAFPEYKDTSLVFRTHNMASKLKFVIFLSKTGTLNVKDLTIEKLAAKDSFDILVDEMDRQYSYFEQKEIDWNALANRYRDKVDLTDSDKFVDVVSDMLAELKDTHVWMEYRRNRISKYVSRFEPNFDFGIVNKDLKDAEEFGDFGITAITNDGFGYIRITSLAADPVWVQKMAADIRERLFDTPGIILDIRRNSGGSEYIAQQIGSMFADEERVYARSKFRAGQGHDEFVEIAPRKIIRADLTYTNPVVCLIGPGAVSSAEGFAMIMKSLPHATLIGLPTRGASGNPQPVQLPNGVDVWFSRWASMLPDGTPIEDVGVAPDEEIEHGENDPTYTRGLEHLKNSVK